MSKHGETEEPQALMQFSKSQHDTEEKCEIFFRPNLPHSKNSYFVVIVNEKVRIICAFWMFSKLDSFFPKHFIFICKVLSMSPSQQTYEIDKVIF